MSGQLVWVRPRAVGKEGKSDVKARINAIEEYKFYVTLVETDEPAIIDLVDIAGVIFDDGMIGELIWIDPKAVGNKGKSMLRVRIRAIKGRNLGVTLVESGERTVVSESDITGVLFTEYMIKMLCPLRLPSDLPNAVKNCWKILQSLKPEDAKKALDQLKARLEELTVSDDFNDA